MKIIEVRKPEECLYSYRKGIDYIPICTYPNSRNPSCPWINTFPLDCPLKNKEDLLAEGWNRFPKEE